MLSTEVEKNNQHQKVLEDYCFESLEDPIKGWFHFMIRISQESNAKLLTDNQKEMLLNALKKIEQEKGGLPIKESTYEGIKDD